MTLSIRISCLIVAIVQTLIGIRAEAGVARPHYVKAMINREPYSPIPGVPPATPAEILLQGLNGGILEQYQAVTLVEIHTQDKDALKQRGDANDVAVTLHDEFDTIFINGMMFDARDGYGIIPDGQTADPPYCRDVKGMWVLQFIGPVKEEWLAAVSQEGIVAVQYLPHHAFIVAATTEEIGRASALRFVQWTTQMHRFLKTVTSAPEQGDYFSARVFLVQTEQSDLAVDYLASLSRVTIGRWPSSEPELQIVGIFRADRQELILSQPLVWALDWSHDSRYVTDLPTTSAAALFVIAVSAVAGALWRLRSG